MEYQDITKSGVGGLNGLKGISAQDAEDLKKIKEEQQRIASSSVHDIRNQYNYGDRSIGIEVNNAGYGESVYDTEAPILYSDLQNLNEVRAQRQSGLLQIINGIGKGAVLAGTTFADGTAGLIWGIGESLKRWIDDDYTAEEAIAGIWDNDFSKAMQNLNEMSEKAMPNYYSKNEQEDPLGNIFSANFLGDKLLKNMGFMVGAAYSGGVYSKALNAFKIPQMAGLAQKGKVLEAAKTYRATRTSADLKKYIDISRRASETPAMINTVTGSFMSAVNEGRIEAINTAKEWGKSEEERIKLKLTEDKQILTYGYESEVNKLAQEYEQNKGTLTYVDGRYVDLAYENYKNKLDQLTQEYKRDIHALDEASIKTLEQLELNRANVGNMTLGINIPILTLSNFKVLGKFYSGGFNTGRRVSKIKGTVGNYKADYSKLGGITAGIKASAIEGTEEISQKAGSITSGNYYSQDSDNFYAAQLDPNAEQQTLDFLSTAGKSIIETAVDPHSWEEFLVGFLSGGLGMPSIRSTKNAEGKFQMPITFQGGAFGAFKDYYKDSKRTKEIVNYLNNRVNSPDVKNYFQSLVRHDKYENIKNQALQEGDIFEYNNADHAQLVSDIMMFDNAGKLDDLYTLIDSAFEYSPENLEAIKKNTTIQLEDGSFAGPFVDAKGNFKSDDEIKTKLEESKNAILNTINNYVKSKNDIDISTGERFNEDQLQELTWIKSQLGNWQDRLDSLLKSENTIQGTLSKLFGFVDEQIRILEQLKTEEGAAYADISEEYKKLSEQIKSFTKTKNIIQELMHSSSRTFGYTITENKNLRDALTDEDLLNISNITPEEKQSFLTDIEDIIKISKGIQSYSDKFAEYFKNPEKITKKHQNIQDQIQENKNLEQQQQFENNLTNNNVSDLNTSIKNNELSFSAVEEYLNKQGIDIDNLDDIDEDDLTEPQKKAISVVQMHDAMEDVQKALESIGVEESILEDAIALLDASYENSDSIEDFIDPTNEAYNDALNLVISEEEQRAGIDEDALNERHSNALQAIQEALKLVEEQQEQSNNLPKDNTNNNTKNIINREAEEKEEKSGKDGADKLPPVNKDQESVSTEEYIPTPDISNLEKLNEGKDPTENNINNSDNIETVGGKKQYWGIGLNEFPIHQDKYSYDNILEAIEKGTLKDAKGRSIVYSEEEKKRIRIILQHLIANSNNGAFYWAKEANPGDKVYFETNPAVNKAAEDFVIFIKNENGLLIGVLPSEKSNTFTTYTGLPEFVKQFKEEFDKSEEKELGLIFTSSQSTNIHKKMIGRVRYQKQYVPISSNEALAKQKIAIAASNGSNSRMIIVAGRLKKTVIKDPNDIENTVMSPLNATAGQPYLLLPTGDPKRSHFPVPFRMDTYSRKHSNTKLGKAIDSVLMKLLNITSNSEAIKIKEELQELLSLPKLFIKITDKNKLQILYTPIGAKQQLLWGDSMDKIQANPQAYLEVLKQNIERANISFQVSRKYINGHYYGQDYNSMIMEIAESNVYTDSNHIMVNDWFTMVPVGQDKVKSPKSTKTNPNATMAKPEEFIYTQGDTELHVNLKDYTIKDSEGKEYTGKDANIVKAMAFGYKNNLSGQYKTEWGYFDSTKQKFLPSEAEIQKTIDKILELSKTIKLTPDGKQYKDLSGNIYERVTTVIQEDSDVDPFDPNSPWILPSTTIGNEVDELIRQIFSGDIYYDTLTGWHSKDNKPIAVKFSNLRGDIETFMLQVYNLKRYLENSGMKLISNGVKAFGKVQSNGKEILVAGTLDILAVDKEGNYHIFDMKTHRSSITDSKKTKWSKQLTLYKQLLESQYEIKVMTLNIIPIKVMYPKTSEADYFMEDGILKYTYKGSSIVHSGGNVQDLESIIPLEESKLNLQNKNVGNEVLLSEEESLSSAKKKRIVNSIKKENIWKSLNIYQQNAILNKTSMKQQQIIKALDLAYDVKSGQIDVKKLGKSIDDLIGVTPKYRKKDSSKGKISKKEQRWLNKNFPQLGAEGSLRVVEGLIKISEVDGGGFAYGQFKNGIITIGSNAARGTIYHEAFHAVMHTLLKEDEISELFAVAKEKYGNKSIFILEEDLAESFRRYMQIEEIPFIGKGIKLFRFIKHIIKNFFGKESYLDKVFYNISQGNYNQRESRISKATKNRIIDDIDYLKSTLRDIDTQIKQSNSVFNLREELIEIIKNRNINKNKNKGIWKTIEGQKLAIFSTAKYKSESDARDAIPNKYKNIVTVVQYLGEYSLYVKSVEDLKEQVLKDNESLQYEKIQIQEQINSLENNIQEEVSNELLELQEVYYRKIEQYHRDKYMFGNLSEENQQYIKDRKIPIKEYNKLSAEEQEILLHCK